MSGRRAHTGQAAVPRPWTAGARLELRKEEAAAALGISDESFDRYVRPSLPTVRLGTLRLYPVAAIEAWLAERASAPAEDIATGIAAPLRPAMADGRRARGPRGQRGSNASTAFPTPSER